MTYPPAPVPPPNNRRTLRIVLIVVGVVLALCCAGAAIGGWFIYDTVRDGVAPARNATVSYLDAVRDGDHQRAYDQLCEERREQLTLAEFSQQRESQPKLVAYEITGLHVSNNNGRVGGTATVRLETEIGADTTQIISLVRENGDWRVCS